MDLEKTDNEFANSLFRIYVYAANDGDSFADAFAQMKRKTEIVADVAEQMAIRHGIASLTGFDVEKIVLLESTESMGVPTFVDFGVNGRGFWTDFKTWGFSPAHDSDKE